MATPTADVSSKPWFDISIDAKSTFQVGHTVALTVEYTAHYATALADLRVTLPEVEYARRSGWGRTYRTDLDSAVPAAVQAQRGLSAAEMFTQTTSFSVPAPGLYRVHALARAQEPQPTGATGSIARTSHEILWLLVNDTGGRVLTAFDSTAIPAAYQPQPGPFRYRRAPRPTGGDGFSRSGAASRSGATPGSGMQTDCASVVCIPVSYYNLDMTFTGPVLHFTYSYTIRDDLTDRVLDRGTRSTADGRMMIDCPSVGWYGYGRISLANDAAIIQRVSDPGEGGPVSMSFYIYGNGCTHNNRVMMARSAELHVWENAQYVIARSRDVFPSRPQVAIRVNPLSATSQCHYKGGGDDYIVLRETDDAKCIWGARGLWVFAHEYGHALHEKMLGGLVDHQCADGHSSYEELDLGCTYNEGWADYHAAVTDSVYDEFDYSANWSSPEDYEYNRFRDTRSDPVVYRHFTAPEEDGSRYHGEVTAFFMDLFDEANESFDLIDLDEMDVLGVMGACRVRPGFGRFARPRGIDDLIWCLQARVDARGEYFNSRGQHSWATEQNQSGHSWTEEDIRRLWLANLYHKTLDGEPLDRGELPTWSAPPPDPVAPPPPPPPPDAPPTVSFRWACGAAHTCDFWSTATDDRGIEGYLWSFAGNSVSEALFTHQFSGRDTLDVQLKVTDTGMQSDSVTQTVVVPPDSMPVPVLSVECVGLRCTFDGSASTDDHGITRYEWYINGEELVVGPTASVVEHEFPSAGSYFLSLWVRDGVFEDYVWTGHREWQGARVTVSDSLVAGLAVDCEDLRCVFDGSRSWPPGGIAEYRWSVDGVVVDTTTVDSLAHAFGSSGDVHGGPDGSRHGRHDGRRDAGRDGDRPRRRRAGGGLPVRVRGGAHVRAVVDNRRAVTRGSRATRGFCFRTARRCLRTAASRTGSGARGRRRWRSW